MSKLSPDNFEQERKKLNALVLVTYKVAQKLPDNEILRARIQEAVLDILKLSEFAYLGSKENIDKFVASVRTLVNYFELAEAQDWIDKTNFIILKKFFRQFLTEFKADSFSVSVKTDVAKDSPLVKNITKLKISREKLNKRQIKILEHLRKNKTGEVAQLADLLSSVSKRTIRRDLDKLIGNGLATKRGKTNGTVYELV